jgi:hypothetical protein
MLRSLVLAAAALAAGLPVARGDDPKPPPLPTDRIEALHKDLNKKIADLQADVAALKAQAARLEAQQGAVIDTWEARNTIDRLQNEVTRLRDQIAAADRGSSSTSNLGPQGNGYNRMPEGRRDSKKIDLPSEPLRAGRGYLRIVNDSAFAHEVVVNGRSFIVPGLNTADLPVAPGEFSYQVVGRTALRQRTVPAGMVFTANIEP